MLSHRFLSAVTLIPLVVLLVYLGGVWFLALILVAVGIAAWEYVSLVRQAGYRPPHAFALAPALLLILDAYCPAWGLLRPGLTLILASSLVWQLFQEDSPTSIEDWALPIAGGLYLGWFAGHFITIRALDNGLILTSFTLLVLWSTDTAAYFVGRLWGRHKMWPRWSPKKTWEGACGGLAGGMTCSILLAWLFGLGIEHGLALGILIPTLTPFGDLAISMIKRRVGAKDSGHIIPGHGGLLDRIDSLLFAAVIVYYYVIWIAGT
ncbi:MAG: phosphatidate cytidylyltransferase [Chloroflexota bacterium]|nr:phosphatidate cytidylyltransferase [Chloroflexota bacterium]